MNELYPHGLCAAPGCYGKLEQTNISGCDLLVCASCGLLLQPDDERTEADGVDLFDIAQAKCTAAELEPPRWHPDRQEFDHLDTFEDILPWTRTTHY